MQPHSHNSWWEGTTQMSEYRQQGPFGTILDVRRGMPTFKILISILPNCLLERCMNLYSQKFG